jgi:hypothetical protein
MVRVSDPHEASNIFLSIYTALHHVIGLTVVSVEKPTPSLPKMVFVCLMP